MDFAKLKTLISGQADPLAYLRELVAVDAGQIPRRDLKIVLLGRGKLDAVASAVPLFFTDPDFATIRVADPLTQGVFTQLQGAGVLSAADVAALNALGSKLVSRWQAEGFTTEPQAGDIAHALALAD